jgi:hypothetical protein
MSPRSKKEWFETIFLRYQKASPKENTVILSEFHKWGLYGLLPEGGDGGS